jgi:hypothetical protein
MDFFSFSPPPSQESCLRAVQMRALCCQGARDGLLCPTRPSTEEKMFLHTRCAVLIRYDTVLYHGSLLSGQLKGNLAQGADGTGRRLSGDTLMGHTLLEGVASFGKWIKGRYTLRILSFLFLHHVPIWDGPHMVRILFLTYCLVPEPVSYKQARRISCYLTL